MLHLDSVGETSVRALHFAKETLPQPRVKQSGCQKVWGRNARDVVALDVGSVLGL